MNRTSLPDPNNHYFLERKIGAKAPDISNLVNTVLSTSKQSYISKQLSEAPVGNISISYTPVYQLTHPNTIKQSLNKANELNLHMLQEGQILSKGEADEMNHAFVINNLLKQGEDFSAEELLGRKLTDEEKANRTITKENAALLQYKIPRIDLLRPLFLYEGKYWTEDPRKSYKAREATIDEVIAFEKAEQEGGRHGRLRDQTVVEHADSRPLRGPGGYRKPPPKPGGGDEGEEGDEGGDEGDLLNLNVFDGDLDFISNNQPISEEDLFAEPIRSQQRYDDQSSEDHNLVFESLRNRLLPQLPRDDYEEEYYKPARIAQPNFDAADSNLPANNGSFASYVENLDEGVSDEQRQLQQLYDEDVQMDEYIQDVLGSNREDVVRLAQRERAEESARKEFDRLFNQDKQWQEVKRKRQEELVRDLEAEEIPRTGIKKSLQKKSAKAKKARKPGLGFDKRVTYGLTPRATPSRRQREAKLIAQRRLGIEEPSEFLNETELRLLTEYPQLPRRNNNLQQEFDEAESLSNLSNRNNNIQSTPVRRRNNTPSSIRQTQERIRVPLSIRQEPVSRARRQPTPAFPTSATLRRYQEQQELARDHAQAIKEERGTFGSSRKDGKGILFPSFSTLPIIHKDNPKRRRLS